jgi:hypothetical protein
VQRLARIEAQLAAGQNNEMMAEQLRRWGDGEPASTK